MRITLSLDLAPTQLSALEELCRELQDRVPPQAGLSWQREMCGVLGVGARIEAEINRWRSQQWETIPSTAKVCTIAEWQAACATGISPEGVDVETQGFLAYRGQMSRSNPITAADYGTPLPEGFTHVAWFNR